MGKMNLLKESRRAFQFLHNTCGMDFKKPYVYVEGNGKFTLKTLERMMNLEGNPYQYKIALFLGGVGCNTYPYSHISCVQIVAAAPEIYENYGENYIDTLFIRRD